MANKYIEAFRPEESLDSIFTRLIAEKDTVPEPNVTVEYIRQQREKLIYPNARYIIPSTYGGYDHDGLIFLTRNEFDKIGQLVEEFMQEIYHETF